MILMLRIMILAAALNNLRDIYVYTMTNDHLKAIENILLI